MSTMTRVRLTLAADLLFVFLLSRLSTMLAISFVTAQLLTLVASLVTTIFLHRYLTHEGITYLHPRIIAGCKFFVWLLTGINWDQWVAVHLKHHAFTDREGDPHSPTLLGWIKVQLFNAYYYAKEARNPATIAEYAPHIKRYAGIWGRFPFSVGYMGPILGTIALCVVMGLLWNWVTPETHGMGLISLMGLAWGVATGLTHAVMYIGGSGAVNSLCHTFGYRNFDNTATNPGGLLGAILDLWVTGEKNHNNHHGYPRSAKFRAIPQEFDLAWPIIDWWIDEGWAKVFQSAIDRMESEAAQRHAV